ncbi:MAG: hypothetical protein ABIK72_07735 [candidate division WOR-3 bacterium]
MKQVGKIIEIKDNLLKVIAEKFVFIVPKTEIKLVEEDVQKRDC